MTDPRCAKCGEPRSNHPYRHPFVGPSLQDDYERLQARMDRLEEALRAAQMCADTHLIGSEASYDGAKRLLKHVWYIAADALSDEVDT